MLTLPYDPDTAPLINFINMGYRPADYPGQIIGPVMHCIIPRPGPDAEIPYSTKFAAAYEDPLKILKFMFPGEAQSAYPQVHVAPVFLDGAMEYLLTAITILLIFWLADRFTVKSEALRGSDKSGWI